MRNIFEMLPKTPFRKKISDNQRDMVRALNASGLGHFFRVKNIGGFDENGDHYRKYGDFDCIPHICGFLKNSGRAVFIEPKYLQKVDKREKLIYPVKISQKMKDFLNTAWKSGALAGVAFTVEDALGIGYGNSSTYLRHPRTYCFLGNDPLLRSIEEDYKAKKKVLIEINKDPLARDILFSAG